MKHRIVSFILLFFLLSVISSLPRAHSTYCIIMASDALEYPQESPAKKPRYDYMSTYLSRNTKPLGLKEDVAIKKLLSQPHIKWAIRARERHILD